MTDEIPDLLGDEARRGAVYTAIERLQAQVWDLTIMQAANGHSDEDYVAGLDPVTTYAERRANLHAGVERLHNLADAVTPEEAHG